MFRAEPDRTLGLRDNCMVVMPSRNSAWNASTSRSNRGFELQHTHPHYGSPSPTNSMVSSGGIAIADGTTDAQNETVTESQPQAQRKSSAKSRSRVLNIQGSKTTSCPICGVLLLKRTLPRHVKYKHQPQVQAIRCAYCTKTFSRRNVRDRHEEEQHGTEVSLMECLNCGQEIRKRTKHEHLRSRRCMEARNNSQILEARRSGVFGAQGSREVTVNTCESVIYPDVSGRFGLVSVADPVIVYCILMGTLWGIRCTLLHQSERRKRIFELPVLHMTLPRGYQAELLELRELAILLLQRDLVGNPRRRTTQVVLLHIIDSLIFGPDSEACAAHRSYLKSWYTSDVRWYLDQTARLGISVRRDAPSCRKSWLGIENVDSIGKDICEIVWRRWGLAFSDVARDFIFNLLSPAFVFTIGVIEEDAKF